VQTVLAVGLDEAERVRISTCESVEVVEGSLAGALTAETLAVVIGSAVDDPLHEVQLVRAADSLVSVLVLVPPADPAGIVERARSTPFLGRDVTFRPCDDEDLPQLVQTLAEATILRRRYQRLVDSTSTPFDHGASPGWARTRRYLGALLDHAPFGAALLDEGGRVVAVNQRGKEMIGSGSAVLGRPFAELLDSSVRDVWLPALTMGSTSRDSVVLPFRVTDEVWLEAVVAPEGGGDSGAGCLVIIHDVTERERARDHRRLAERRALEGQHHETVGVLAGGVAHDFNNLLTAILGNLDLLARELPPRAPGHDHLDAAITAAHGAADLVRQLLAYAGRGTYQVREMDPVAFLQEVRPFLLRGLSGEHALDVVVEPIDGTVRGDRAGLQQLIFNLLQNADEAMQGTEGTVTLTLRPVAAPGSGGGRPQSDQPTPTYVELRIEDRGAGIAADVLPRVFEPFFSTKGLGRGLGLPAARGIAETFGGSLTLETRAGEGTTVTVRLPLASGSAGKAPD
jgi:PAS domain S-box-containing protein